MNIKKINSQLHNKINACDLMPTDTSSINILKSRANKITRVKQTILENGEKQGYIHFTLNKFDHYGIPYKYAIAVIDHTKITKIPFATQYVAGVINYRGLLLTVIDLNKFLCQQETKLETESFVIILRSHAGLLGITVDQIKGSNQYTQESLSEITLYDGIVNSKHILGLDKEEIVILNVDSIFKDLKELIGHL